MKKKILIAFIVFVVIIGIIGALKKEPESDVQENTTETTAATVETLPNSIVVDTFIDKYNEHSKIKISDVKDINITDKEGKYYRVEFRLSAFQNAISKAVKIGNSSAEIIHYGNWHKDNIRLYLSSLSEKELFDIFRNVAYILYPTITEQQIEEEFADDCYASGTYLIDDLSGTIEKDENGYYMMIDDNISEFVKSVME